MFARNSALSGFPVHTYCPTGLGQESLAWIGRLHCTCVPSVVWHVQWSQPLAPINIAHSHSTNSHVKHVPEYVIVVPSQFFTPWSPHTGCTVLLSQIELHFHAPNKEFHFTPSQLQKQTWPSASVLFITFNTHCVVELHATQLFIVDSFTNKDHHIVNCANLCPTCVFTTIPFSPITANTLLLSTVLADVPSFHKNELLPDTVAPDHIATDSAPLTLLLTHKATELCQLAWFHLPHTTVE